MASRERRLPNPHPELSDRVFSEGTWQGPIDEATLTSLAVLESDAFSTSELDGIDGLPGGGVTLLSSCGGGGGGGGQGGGCPDAQNDNYNVPQGDVYDKPAPGVLANDFGENLTAQLVSGTTQGSINLVSDGSFVYTPNVQFVGIDSFDYKAVNGFGEDQATATLVVHQITADIDTDSNNDGFISGADDPIEEAQPGRIVFLNDDDDNGNNTPDRDDPGPVANENDLALTLLSVLDDDGPHGLDFDLTEYTAKLEFTSQNIKVWDSGNKGTEITTGKTYTLGAAYPYLSVSVYVEGVQPGTATIDLALLNPNNQEVHRDTVRFTVIDLDLHEVSFSGTGYNAVHDDLDASIAFVAPHWVDNNLDGVPEQNYPVAFVSGTTMQTKTVISADGIAQIPGDVFVRGFVLENPSLDIPATLATKGAGEITLPATSASNPFTADVIDAYLPLHIDWQVKFAAVGQWWDVGTSDNALYVTWKAPITNTAALQHTLVHVGSVNAAGQSTRAGAIDAIWVPFAAPTLDVRRVADNHRLTYYQQWGTQCTGTAQLLATGDSQCGGWARFFLDVLKMQGIDQSNDFWQVIPKDDTETRFLVKNWSFGGTQSSGDPSHPYLNIADGAGSDFYTGTNSYQWIYAEVNDVSGITGQGGVANPHSLFNNHQFVRIDPDDAGADTPGSRPPAFYDPSYGTIYGNLEEFENTYIAGYAIEQDDYIFNGQPEHAFLIRKNPTIGAVDIERDPMAITDY